MTRFLILLTAVLTAMTCATPVLAAEPELEARALLPADASAPAPFPGAPDTEPQPQPGARQPVGGFSALIDAPGRDRFWAMPDNGFGSKGNSRSFLLRLYEVDANWETARGGRGDVEIEDWITLSDPAGHVPFEIVNEHTRARLLTGGDFDIESVRQDRRGDLWFGEEFGPYLLHTDRHGRLKEAPIPLPGVRSPDSAEPGEPNLARSNGFEGMALSDDGRRLYPVLEGPVAGDDPHVRRVYEFDLAERRYERGWREYRVARPELLVADLTLLDDDRFVSLERDNAEGLAARHKQAFEVTLARRGELTKRRLADLLDLRDPARISLPGRPGDVGLGDPFSMPYQTIEAVLPVGHDRLAIVNDTNFGSRGRNPGLPDASDFVVVFTPRPSRDARTLAIIGDTPYGDEQEAAFPHLVADVDDDPHVSAVVHLGDIKNGSSTCDDGRFERLRDLFGTFDDPFLYTPGDNEWTDCHRPAAGGYVPTERLARIRQLFYPETELPVRTQRPPFVENQRWSDAGVVYALVHVVGSDNGRAPWFEGNETPAQRQERLDEVEAREEAALDWIDKAFRAADRANARGVVIGMQADTFAGSTAFDSINERLEEGARRFKHPVLLLQGDTHVYKTDRPLAEAPNLTRVVVQGETASEWLRLTVDPRTRDVFSWKREKLPPRVTVASFNIHHGAGADDTLDLERVAAEIERGGAEVVGLQEVDRHWSERSEFVDQARWLADRLGMEVAYGANLDLDPPAPGLPRRQYGTAILSEHPIVYSRNTHLPRPENGEQRGLLEAAIDVDGVRLRVANTHLQHNSAVERRAQTERIVELLRPVRTPIVLMGDLNAQPGAPELSPLSPRFVDAWPRGGDGEGFTYPASGPNARIDYVLTTADVDVEAARVLSSPASDHLQVAADLVLPRARRPEPARAFDLQAHRGGMGLVTESTLEAFANAIELGVSTLELDVQITEDGHAVVTHDRRVAAAKCRDTEPAFAGDPEYPYVGDYVRNLTLAQVRTLACDKPLPQHPQQRIVANARMPLLSEVFELVDCYDADDVRLNVETKVEAGAPHETAPREQFVQVTARKVREAKLLDQVTIQSFDWGALMRMREVEPRLPIVALTNGDFLQLGRPGASPWLGGIDIDDFGGSLVAAAASFGADAISPVHGNPQDGAVGNPGYRPYTTPALVADAHDSGLAIIPWTVNDHATMASLMDAGVDGIITDYPDRLRTLMAERGLELPKPVREPRGRDCASGGG
jgi:glycerophosphoryl diester phosphodiesterase